MANRVVHFEIHADDPERAAAFYTKAFSWEVKKWDGPMDYWMVTTGPKEEPGINGGIARRSIPVSGEGMTAYPCTIDVKDIDKSIEDVKTSGGAIKGEKMDIPNVGVMIECKDTEGNTFWMMQSSMQM